MPIYTKTWVSDDGYLELTLAPPEEGSQFCLTLRMEDEDDEAELKELIVATDHKELDELIVMLQQIRLAPIPDSDEESEDESESDEDADEDESGDETA